MLHISPSFTEKSYCSDLKMNHLNTSQLESKQQKQNSSKNVSGSSNANNGALYVDLGKVLLEAAKTGDAEKVQECIKNGAPFITDWVQYNFFSK